MNTRAHQPGPTERKNGNKPPAGGGGGRPTTQAGSGQANPRAITRSDETESKPLTAKVREQWEEGSAAAAQLADAVSDEVKTGVSEVKQAVTTAGENLGELASDTRAALERTGRSVIRAAKDNPVPAALIGLGCAGLGMLLVDALRPAGSARARSARPRTQQTGPRAQQAQPFLGGARDSAKQALSTVSEKAGQQTERLQGLIEQNPLKAGAGGIAIGIGIGLLIPSLDREHEWLGKGRDQLVERTQELAHSMLEKFETVTQTVSEVVGGGSNQSSNQSESSSSA
jgi:ElaB/YqjD/DUF883 family membrane-anchored ribosome-binding protein